MTVVHAWLGAGLVAAFAVLAVAGLGLRLVGRDEAPTLYWGLQHWTENLLILQTVIGVVFLLLGRRLVGDDLVWLHYLYGSLFPLLAIVSGRIASMRREVHDYVGLAWGAFFAFGLALRALQTGCGGVLDVACLGG
ncbi:hypothetical protein [Salsipaludibacter albus]|uniref:hypothetical protein n=1 Tax=Salsipaludibacter albus TaxID=2849650 RepID=UPI001EE48D4D|nr:hypothetical protein [Salsipaludibacter albus]MBY5163517.1 hypothetical protein [Salsipaludibacter albus]